MKLHCLNKSRGFFSSRDRSSSSFYYLALLLLFSFLVIIPYSHPVAAKEDERQSHQKANKLTVPASKASHLRQQREVGTLQDEKSMSMFSSEEEEMKEFLKKNPWIDLEMTLPPQEDGSGDTHDVSEVSVELRFDDDTPPSKITILDPNITWSGDDKHQMTIRPAEHLTQSHSSTVPPVRTGALQQVETVNAVCNCPDIEEIIAAVLNANILKGTKGDRGDRGLNGIPGLSIQGQKGEPGDALPVPHHSMGLQQAGVKGESGPPGPRGPPGVCSPSDCGSQNANQWIKPPPPTTPPPTQKPLGVPPEKLYKIVPGALVFPTKRAMLQMLAHTFIGTIAFVEEDESFYGRVKSGWKSFSMETRVHRNHYQIPSTQRPLPTRPTQQPFAWQRHPAAAATEEKKVLQNSKPFSNCSKTTSTNHGANQICKDESVPASLSGINELTLPFSSKAKNNTPRTGFKTSNASTISKSEASTKNQRRFKNTILYETPLNQVRIVALNSQLSGNMGGNNQINYQCQRQAMKEHLHGIFRALHLIPSESMLIKSVDSDTEKHFTNLKNESLLSSATKLYSFNGKVVGGSAAAWSRQKSIKTKVNCRGWTSDSSQENGIVYPIEDFGNENLFDQDTEPYRRSSTCDEKHVVLCIEFLHLNQVNMRHRNRNRVRLSFDKYVAILQNYDKS